MVKKIYKGKLIYIIIIIAIVVYALINYSGNTLKNSSNILKNGECEINEYPVFFDPYLFKSIEKGYFENGINSIHPVNASYYALYNYEEWKKSGCKNEVFKQKFLSSSKALLKHIKYEKNENGDDIAILSYDFDWDYAGENIKAPWVSGMAQGMAISVLIREYDISNNNETLKAINGLVNSLINDSRYYDEVTKDDGKTFWIEEYPKLNNGKMELKSSVLNGGLLGSIGLLEFTKYFESKKTEDYVDKIEKYLVKMLPEYNFDGNEPAYGLLDYRLLEQKKHYINFESTNSSNNKLPIYEVSVNLNNNNGKPSKQLRVMRTTGGSKDYEFENFLKGTEFHFLISSDGTSNNKDFFEVINIKLRDSNGIIVGETSASDNGFYGESWSDPYQKEGVIRRKFFPGENPYKGINGTGHFKINLNKTIDKKDDLYVELEYINNSDAPINIYMYNKGRFNLGFASSDNSNGAANIENELFYIPRARDFESYSFYKGWNEVESIEGRRVQSFNMIKDYSTWNGGWIEFKFDEEDLSKLKEDELIELKVSYYDSVEETIFVNLYNAGNRHIGILNNTGSHEWKEDIFYIPCKYFINEGSSSPKTKIVVDTLKYLSEKRNNMFFYDMSKRWNEGSLYNGNMRNFIVYQNTDNLNEYIFKFNKNQIYFPKVTSSKWENIDGSYKLSLDCKDFAYFNIPEEEIDDFEINIKSKNTSTDKILLAQLDKEKSTIINITEFSGQDIKNIKLKDFIIED